MGLALSMVPAAASASELQVAVEGLRSQRGVLRLCLTRNRAFFPDCKSDPQAIRRSIPASGAAQLHLSGLANGRYALSLMHDENGNGRLDKLMMIPREGFGFSGNPRIRMGPPSFDETLFDIGSAPARQTIKLRYLL